MCNVHFILYTVHHANTKSRIIAYTCVFFIYDTFILIITMISLNRLNLPFTNRQHCEQITQCGTCRYLEVDIECYSDLYTYDLPSIIVQQLACFSLE